MFSTIYYIVYIIYTYLYIYTALVYSTTVRTKIIEHDEKRRAEKVEKKNKINYPTTYPAAAGGIVVYNKLYPYLGTRFRR